MDRDGVINSDKGYVGKIDDFEWLPGVFEACKLAQEKGYLLVIVTNQSGIGRGYYSEEDFSVLTRWMTQHFLDKGIDIAGVYYSPFHPTDGVGDYKQQTECRKPGPKMILDAVKDFDIDVSQSIMIGDSLRDIEAGRRAGVGKLIYIGDKGSVTDDGVLVATSLLPAIKAAMAT